MTTVIHIIVTTFFLVGAYRLGLHDGRIAECRRGFNTVDEAPAVWDACQDRLGKGVLR